MASRALCSVAKSRDDYLEVYDRIIGQAQDKVILHWLGDMFDPQLAGYWASRDVDVAMETVLDLIRAHAGKIDGIKISLLEQRHEEKLRAALPAGVKMYTGDDFNYADLIEGDGKHVSHALLGIFDPIAPAAAAALAASRRRATMPATTRFSTRRWRCREKSSRRRRSSTRRAWCFSPG